MKENLIPMVLMSVGTLIFGWGVFRIWHDRRQRNTGKILLLGLVMMWLYGAALLYNVSSHAGAVLGVGGVVASIFLVFLVSFALVVNGYYVMKREGVSVSHSLPLFAGLAVLAGYGLVVWNMFQWSNQPQPILIIVTVWYVSVVAYVGFNLVAFTLQAVIHGRWPVTDALDVIVVLGAGLIGERVSPLLASRLDRGIAVARSAGAGTIVCSGGQGPDEVISEAEAMARYVESVAPGEFRLLKEDKSTTTQQNLRFSSAFIESELGDGQKVAVVTSNYHALRAGGFARTLGLDWNVFGAPTAMYYIPTAFLREFVASMMFNWKLHTVLIGGFTVMIVLLNL